MTNVKSQDLFVVSETQAYMEFDYHTGIQRVMRETHEYLFDFLSCQGIQLVWCRTKQSATPQRYLEDPYLATDPVLRNGEVDIDQSSVILFIDLNTSIDFIRLAAQKRKSRQSMIFLVHDILPLQMSSTPTHAKFQFRLYLQQVIHLADHIVVTTEKVRQDLLNLGWQTEAEIHVIPLGSYLPTQSSIDIAENQISMLYVSTIEPRKGHDLLLDSFDLLLKRGFDVDLKFVGRYGWDRDEVKSRIENHPEFGSRLHWYRSADDYAMRAIARKCNIGVFPSEGEGFGLFLEEGLSMGLSMVVSNVQEFHERSGPGVYLSEMNPEGLSTAILAAHQEWNGSNQRSKVRSMQDFAFDLSKLIMGEIERRKVPCA